MAQMTQDTAPTPRPRVRVSALVLLALTAFLSFFLLSVVYGLSREYGDTLESAREVALRSFREWSFGIVIVLCFAGLTAWAARRSRGRRVLTGLAVAASVLTLVGVPAVAITGVHEKYAAFPEVPNCTGEFTDGPAVPVTRAAQEAFEQIDHPGPFGGGGSSGVDGCASTLVVGEEVDVPAAYRSALGQAGWQVKGATTESVTATRDGQDFEATKEADEWWVWIGPAGLEQQETAPGEVAPRR